MRLENRVAVVTGSGTGIGRSIAFAFAREGAAVVVNYAHSADAAKEAVEEITSAGGRAVSVGADVSKEEDAKKLVRTATEEFGRLDILVNNAGIEHKMPFLETPLDVWEKTLAVNLTGPWLCSQEAAKILVDQGSGGRIINISSVHEDRPMPTNSPYCATKGALRMLMRTICVELAPHNITVNNIAPGAIETPINKETLADESLMKELLSEIPLNRMGKPEEVASLAVYLASEEAAYSTGSTFFVDGGMMRHAGSL